MTENRITKERDLKRGLIIATVVTMTCTTIIGILSVYFWGDFQITFISVMALFLILWILFKVFLAWKHYRDGNMQLAVKSRKSMLLLSIIPLAGFLFFTVFMLLLVVGRY